MPAPPPAAAAEEGVAEAGAAIRRAEAAVGGAEEVLGGGGGLRIDLLWCVESVERLGGSLERSNFSARLTRSEFERGLSPPHHTTSHHISSISMHHTTNESLPLSHSHQRLRLRRRIALHTANRHGTSSERHTTKHNTAADSRRYRRSVFGSECGNELLPFGARRLHCAERLRQVTALRAH